MNLSALIAESQAEVGRPALVIQCGARKAPAPTVGQIYTHGLWATYRAAREEVEGALRGPHPRLRVFVLSAEHGLLPETASCPVYDRVLVPDTFRGDTLRGTPVRRVGQLVPRVAEQAAEHGLSEVVFAGGEVYHEALVRAGLSVRWLDRRGIGYKRSTLRDYVARWSEAP